MVEGPGDDMVMASEYTAYSAHVVTTPADHEGVFQLRYEVYIAEQGKDYSSVDHEKRLFSDEQDEWSGTTIAVRSREGRTDATVRCTYLSDERAYDHFRDRFLLDSLREHELGDMVVCSRLAVRPAIRRTEATTLAFTSIYEHELQRGAAICYQYCAEGLKPLFEHYGFREFLPPVDDAVLGRALRMALVLDDVESFEQTQSPFLQIARSTGATGKVATRFRSAIATAAGRVQHA